MDNFNTTVDENNIVHISLGGSLKKENLPELRKWAEDTANIVKETHEKTGQKVKAVIDLTNLHVDYDPQDLMVIVDLMKANEPHMFKAGTFGAATGIRFATDVALTMAGRTNLKSFKTKEEALVWLSSFAE